MRSNFASICFFLIIAASAGTNRAEAKPAFSFSPPSGWKTTQAVSGVSTWSAEDERKTLFSVLSHEKEDAMDFAPVPTPELIRVVSAVRSASLEQIGVLDWTIDEHERATLPNKQGTLLKLYGHYTGSDQARVEFVEWHYYLGKRFIQATLSRRGNKAQWSAKEADPIMKRLKF